MISMETKEEKVIVNVIEASAKDILQSIHDAKRVSKLNLDAKRFLDYVHTCVVLGTLPIERNTYDETSIDEYKVIDAISCLSHFVARVNVVTKDSLNEVNHLKEKVLNLELNQPVITDVVEKEADEAEAKEDNKSTEAKAAETAVPYMARVLSVDVFNRVTTVLRGALRCGETTITRTRFTLSEMHDLAHVAEGKYFDNGNFEYAPVRLDVSIYDEYEAISRAAFLKHFRLAIVKELSSKVKASAIKSEE